MRAEPREGELIRDGELIRGDRDGADICGRDCMRGCEGACIRSRPRPKVPEACGRVCARGDLCESTRGSPIVADWLRSP